eukprot:TRINITY_DN3497_c0_g1_i3.p1 TRINITY_DN3497_c0_g1~~TRINITY_DN3497_c0_g1_i3.p1  ORF type:complete len:186 (-),score=24.43 TRINITY_DN3497_c0_g1_i3:639-1196(-)
MRKNLIVLIVFSFFIVSFSATIRPIVLMHGITADAASMDTVVSWIKKDYPEVYIHNMEIGDGFWSSIFMDINKQVESFAETVAKDPKLKDGFNLIGYSQGGLITRAYIERYNNPPVHNYLSLLGPHQGVYGTPEFNSICPDTMCPWLDEFVDYLLNQTIIDAAFQEKVTFASYWRDPFHCKSFVN